MKAIISTDNLTKTFRVQLGRPGVVGALKSFVSPTYQEVHAVNGISFSINEGERVAFIGPNGAGKSTTIKMLTGILMPTTGNSTVLGLTPWQSRIRLNFSIGAIFGQRSQLWYHLPAKDSFDLLARIYEIDDTQYKRRLDELVALFKLDSIIVKPVRQLSLGERMRCELVGCMLHRPRILFLDEPTIGLDVPSRSEVRKLIKRSSENEGTTVLLTSHDTGDIERVCDRVVVINHGVLVLDNSLRDLQQNYIKERIVTIKTEEESLIVDLPGVTQLKQEPFLTSFRVNTEITSIDAAVTKLLSLATIKDLQVENPPMDRIIKTIYKQAL